MICRGKFRKKNFICDGELIIDGKKKKAETHFKVLAHFGEHALLKCTLLSGKKHQIRRHCLTLGHPILGDDKYGDFEYNKKYRAKLGQLPLFLHAYDLEFNSSKLAIPEYIKTPLLEEFASFLRRYNVPAEQYFLAFPKRGVGQKNE